MDYGFFGVQVKKTAKEYATLRCLCCWCVTDAQSAKRGPGARNCHSCVGSLGYRKVILKRDQESSLRAEAQAVKNSWTGEIILEHSPVGDS